MAEYKMLKDIIANHYSNGILNALNFDFEKLTSNTIEYVKSMKVGDEIGVYKYSSSTSKQNIYSSAYACMIFSLFGKIDEITIQDKHKWAQYFDSFQSSKDRLFKMNL